MTINILVELKAGGGSLAFSVCTYAIYFLTSSVEIEFVLQMCNAL